VYKRLIRSIEDYFGNTGEDVRIILKLALNKCELNATASWYG
jgi:hypothetical protein